MNLFDAGRLRQQIVAVQVLNHAVTGLRLFRSAQAEMAHDRLGHRRFVVRLRDEANRVESAFDDAFDVLWILAHELAPRHQR